MSTVNTGVRGRGQPTGPGGDGHAGDTLEDWRARTNVFLQPIAAPSILGLFGFAAATFVVSAWMVGWYGGAATPALMFEFAAALGGIAQGIAAIWSYHARDGIATAVHGIWAAFWLAFGLMWLLVTVGDLPVPPAHAAIVPFGYWMYAMGALTLFSFVASLGENLAVASVLLPLAAGALLVAIYYSGVDTTSWTLKVGGYLLMVSSFTAAYTGTALMMASSWGRTVLPLGTINRFSHRNLPGRVPVQPIEYEMGEPGVKQGQ